MQANIKLFSIGFMLLTFLSANTFFIANKNFGMIILSSFITNILFSISIKKLAFSGWSLIVSYSAGCAFGCAAGTYLASIIIS